ILEAIYEARGDWDKLIGALEILARTSDDPARKVALLRKVGATAATQLGQLDRAMDALARAVREDPASIESRSELEVLAQHAGAWDRVIDIYAKVAAGLHDPALAREYWMRLASIQEQLDKSADAAKSYERVLALDAGDVEALQ